MDSEHKLAVAFFALIAFAIIVVALSEHRRDERLAAYALCGKPGATCTITVEPKP